MNLRRIDEILAEKVMGGKNVLEQHQDGPRIRAFTSDLNAAFDVARELKIALVPLVDGRWWAIAEGADFGFDPEYSWYERGWNKPSSTASESASLAICLEALKHLDVPIPD